MTGGPPASQSPEELVGNTDSQVTLAEILTSWVQSGQRESENHVSQGESRSALLHFQTLPKTAVLSLVDIHCRILRPKQ